MTTRRNTPRNILAGGFVTAVLIGLGASPATAAGHPRHDRPPAPARQVAAVVPVTATRAETVQATAAGE